MRCYDPRHPVAILRKIIGLNQGELATLAGCSKRTIQAIEIGRLTLSRSLATKISHGTGVAEGWLLGGDIHAPPRMILTDAPYTKKIFEDTQAAIASGNNPNPLTINLSHEGAAFLQAPPVLMMAKFFEQLNSLLHPQMDYWLASILAAIFAATKTGHGRLAVRRMADFSEAMTKEFGQRFDDEFTNDATVVLEQSLQRIKVTELLVADDGSQPSPPSKTSTEKEPSTRKDPLADAQVALESEDFDVEAIYAKLNDVGDRLKARRASARKAFETFNSEMMAVFRTPKPNDQQSKSSGATKPSTQGRGGSEGVVQKTTKGR